MSKLLETVNPKRCVMLYVKRKSGFTLMEVLVSVAVAGLVISAGFKLIAMSYKLMAELEIEQELISASQKIWLRFRTDEDMPDNGTEDNITWRTERDSVQVGEDYELKFRRVIISIGNRSTNIYLAE